MTGQQWSDMTVVAVMGLFMAAVLVVAIIQERGNEIRRAREADQPRNLPPSGVSWIDGRDELRAGR